MSIVISREEAARTGSKRYYTGVPCKKGHLSQRWVCNTQCLACARPEYLPPTQASAFTPVLVWAQPRLKINRNLSPETQATIFSQLQGWVDHLTEQAGLESARQLEVAVNVEHTPS